jgi:hypothetical protein
LCSGPSPASSTSSGTSPPPTLSRTATVRFMSLPALAQGVWQTFKNFGSRPGPEPECNSPKVGQEHSTSLGRDVRAQDCGERLRFPWLPLVDCPIGTLSPSTAQLVSHCSRFQL